MPKISVAVIQRVFDLLRHFDGRRYPVAQALRLRLLLTGHCTHEKPYRKFVQLCRSVIRKTRRLLKSYCYNIGVRATAPQRILPSFRMPILKHFLRRQC